MKSCKNIQFVEKHEQLLYERKRNMEKKKFVYSFNEGSKDMKELLGGKGAGLAEMTKIGLPVPFGFTVTTQACSRY